MAQRERERALAEADLVLQEGVLERFSAFTFVYVRNNGILQETKCGDRSEDYGKENSKCNSIVKEGGSHSMAGDILSSPTIQGRKLMPYITCNGVICVPVGYKCLSASCLGSRDRLACTL